jgi:hypothetical protein
MGWLGLIFCILGNIGLGYKKRWAWLLCIIGQIFWLFWGIITKIPETTITAIIFGSLAFWNWYQWRKL